MVSLTLVGNRWAVVRSGRRPTGTPRYLAAIGKRIRPPSLDNRSDGPAPVSLLVSHLLGRPSTS